MTQFHDPQARIRAVIEEHGHFVTRTLRRAGVPRSDLEDEVQRTFIVVAERLERVAPGAEKSYVYQVANNLAWHVRRGLARRREVLGEDPPDSVEAFETPEYLTHRKGMREILDRITASMPDAMRCVFVLYELEGVSLIDIATALGIPRGTVVSRLRRARAHFRGHLSAIELAWDLGAEGANRIDERGLMRAGRRTRLERALCAAGASVRASASMRARTLAVLGLS